MASVPYLGFDCTGITLTGGTLHDQRCYRLWAVHSTSTRGVIIMGCDSVARVIKGATRRSLQGV